MTHIHLPLTPDWLVWPIPFVWALLLVLLIPVLWWLWQHAHRRAALRFSNIALARAAGRTWRPPARIVLPLLRCLAIICLIVAVARPQTPHKTRRTTVEGVAIEIVLDTSASMLDFDLSPPDEQSTRLDVARSVIRRFITGDDTLPGRPNDLIGLLRFAQYADCVCPLTLDRDALLEVLDQTRVPVDTLRRAPSEYNQTAIGDGLALAVARLKDLKRTAGSGEQYTIASRVVILLTDGENNTGLITPDQAGQLAATFGIKVYTVLAGTGQNLGSGLRQPADDAELQRIATLTGGRHYIATSSAALVDVYAEIDQLERSRIEQRCSVTWGELSWWWLAVAFAALSLQTLLDATWLRKIP